MERKIIANLKNNYIEIIRNQSKNDILELLFELCDYYGNKYRNIEIYEISIKVKNSFEIIITRGYFYILLELTCFSGNESIKKNSSFIYDDIIAPIVDAVEVYLFECWCHDECYLEKYNLDENKKYDVIIYKNTNNNFLHNINHNIFYYYNYYFSDLYKKVPKDENPWLVKDLKNLLLTYIE